MRASTAALASSLLALVGCGSVKNTPDADVGPELPDSGTPADGPTTDTPPPPGPSARLRWTFDGNTNNTGLVNGFAFTTPAGISYGPGKVGMAAAFGQGQYGAVTGMRQLLGTYAKVTIAFWLKEPGTLNSSAVLDINNRTIAPYGGVQLGFTQSFVTLCTSTTSSPYVGGACGGFIAPAANTWHHWILRYNGTGTGAAQGGPLEVYVDGVLTHTRENDGSNDPVFTTLGIPDTLTIGAPGTQLDELVIYDQVFSTSDQCTLLVGGTLNPAGGCALP